VLLTLSAVVGWLLTAALVCVLARDWWRYPELDVKEASVHASEPSAEPMVATDHPT
jgi:hypothetical protein